MGRNVNDDEPKTGPDARIAAAIKFMQRVTENDSVNRVNAQYWRKFRDGQQWPAEVQNSRNLEQRPCITVNKTDVYCLSVENQQRQQRPRIKVDPTNGPATKKTADVIKGMIRHIEATKSGADMAYDKGFEGADTEGVGYFRIMSDYVREDSFEQELFFMPVEDPLSVYFDDHSIMPDGSDNEETLIVSDMGKEAFKAAHPEADDGASFVGVDQGTGDWITKDSIRVAEYFTIKKDRAKLVKLSTGEIGWEDKLDDVVKAKLFYPKPDDAPESVQAQIASGGVAVLDSRDSARRTVQWCKLTAVEILDERDLPGRWIPVFPVYGRKTIIDGKVRRSGLIKNAVGPQQMSNYWKTAATETVALAAKAKWLIAEGQDEGHVEEWDRANTTPRQVLRYKPTDIDGRPAPPPERVQPEPPPEGILAMTQMVDNDLSSVLGIIEPAQRIGGNVSGKALQAERLQSDQNTFHLYDNLTRSIAFAGRYLLDVMKFYYSEPGRVVRIIGDDGKSKTQAINQPDAQDPAKIINDITVGEYDVVMDTGPGYNTKRQEAVDSMMPLFEKNEMLMQQAGDIMFRNMDFPGAETIADRLAAANPLSQIDESSEIPPQAQTMIKGLQEQLKQAQGQIQEAQGLLKSRADVEGMKQAAETHRLTVKEAGATDRAKMADDTKQLDTHLRVATTAHDAIIKSQTQERDTKVKTDTQKVIQAMKDRIAVILAEMDAEQADQSSDETTERAI